LEFSLLYDHHFHALAAYAGKLMENHAAGEDIAQEAFLRAQKNEVLLSSLTDGQQKTWLYTTARRLAIDQIRRNTLEPPSEEDPIFQDDLTRLEVVQFLANLPKDASQIFRMRHFAGMNSREIAAALQMNPATVRTKLRSAVNQLKALWHETEE